MSTVGTCHCGDPALNPADGWMCPRCYLARCDLVPLACVAIPRPRTPDHDTLTEPPS